MSKHLPLSKKLPRLDKAGTEQFRIKSGFLAILLVTAPFAVIFFRDWFFTGESIWKDWLVNLSASIPAMVLALVLDRQFRSPQLAWTETKSDTVSHLPFRWIGVSIGNAPNSACLPFYSRDVAEGCEAHVAFFCSCGEPLFEEEFPARWAGAFPEPLKINGLPYLLNDIRSIDIRPGQAESAHFLQIKGEPFEMYVWTNQSYGFDGFVDVKHRIEIFEFIVRLKVIVGGDIYTSLFRVDASQGFDKISTTPLDHDFIGRYRLKCEE